MFFPCIINLKRYLEEADQHRPASKPSKPLDMDLYTDMVDQSNRQDIQDLQKSKERWFQGEVSIASIDETRFSIIASSRKDLRKTISKKHSDFLEHFGFCLFQYADSFAHFQFWPQFENTTRVHRPYGIIKARFSRPYGII